MRLILKKKHLILKKMLKMELFNVDEIIPESFALVREAAKRTLGERHYDVQLAGGLIFIKEKLQK